jgi:selenoprotein W-related protein
MTERSKLHVKIRYCPRCKWLLRAAWYAQELLSTFESELAGVTLSPAPEAGVFTIHVGETVVLDRAVDGFLEAKEIKRKIRDVVAPDRALGHIDG